MNRIIGYALAAVLALMLVVGLVGDRVMGQIAGQSPFTLLATPLNGANPATNAISGFAMTASPRALATCGAPAVLATSGTDTANAANTDTYVAEVDVPYNTITTGVAIYNGTTPAGNSNVFLADSTGHNILATAVTAASGASSYQRIPWTAGATVIQGPGAYYLLFQNSSTTSWRTYAVGNCGTSLLTGTVAGTFPTALIATPPTTFTTVVGPIASLY